MISKLNPQKLQRYTCTISLPLFHYKFLVLQADPVQELSASFDLII